MVCNLAVKNSNKIFKIEFHDIVSLYIVHIVEYLFNLALFGFFIIFSYQVQCADEKILMTEVRTMNRVLNFNETLLSAFFSPFSICR